MPQEFSVNPVELSGKAETVLQPIADESKKLSTNTREALARLGYFAGTDDEVAKAFWSQWTPAVTAIFQMLSYFGGGMALTAANLRSTAMLYQKAEELNIEAAQRLGLR